MKIFAVVLVLAGVMMAADAKPLDSKTQEVHILRLREAFESALFLQEVSMKAAEDAKAAQAKLQSSIDSFNQTIKSEAKELGFPEGTTFNINQETGAVTPVVPAPTPKPASTKPVN